MAGLISLVFYDDEIKFMTRGFDSLEKPLKFELPTKFNSARNYITP